MMPQSNARESASNPTVDNSLESVFFWACKNQAIIFISIIIISYLLLPYKDQKS